MSRVKWSIGILENYPWNRKAYFSYSIHGFARGEGEFATRSTAQDAADAALAALVAEIRGPGAGVSDEQREALLAGADAIDEVYTAAATREMNCARVLREMAGGGE